MSRSHFRKTNQRESGLSKLAASPPTNPNETVAEGTGITTADDDKSHQPPASDEPRDDGSIASSSSTTTSTTSGSKSVVAVEKARRFAAFMGQVLGGEGSEMRLN